jgi:hypothetical protein
VEDDIMSRVSKLLVRPVLWAAAAVLAASPALAQTVEAGSWINLFDGETTFGWTSLGDANWKVVDGVLTADEGTGGLLATTSRFKDYELTLKVRVSRPGTTGVVVRGALEGHASENGSGVIALGGEEGEAAWQEVSVKALGGSVEATVDGKAVEGLAATNAAGIIGIQYHAYHRYNHVRKPSKVEVSEVKLRPLQLTPIFNGVNLDGWNIIPDRESKFEVVDGALRITNGNGQIETAGTYKNFLLQLDIISNGKELNSGVFFRGPVGVFWKGYESQVRNQWLKDDRTKPVDFGTGGMYGVQETRKVVPSDFEWFSKTVIADGNHFAVWINGYQVSDLYDTRPASAEDDGKNGYVKIAGTIHLQGHDPTTDLSFKNINLSQY